MKKYYTREEKIAYWKRKIEYATKRIQVLEAQPLEMRAQRAMDFEYQDWSERISAEVKRLLANSDEFKKKRARGA